MWLRYVTSTVTVMGRTRRYLRLGENFLRSQGVFDRDHPPPRGASVDVLCNSLTAGQKTMSWSVFVCVWQPVHLPLWLCSSCHMRALFYLCSSFFMCHDRDSPEVLQGRAINPSTSLSVQLVLSDTCSGRKQKLSGDQRAIRKLHLSIFYTAKIGRHFPERLIVSCQWKPCSINLFKKKLKRLTQGGEVS